MHHEDMAPALFMHRLDQVREVCFNFVAQTVKKDPLIQARSNEVGGQDLPNDVALLDDPDTIHVKCKVKTPSSQESKNVAHLKIDNTAETENGLNSSFFIEGHRTDISSDDEFVPGDQLFLMASLRSSTKKGDKKMGGRQKMEGGKRQRSSTVGVSKALRAENKKFKAKNMELNAKNEKLDRESKKVKREIKQEYGKNTALTAEKEAVEVQLKRLQGINGELQHDLESISNNIYRVQPLEQISETEVASKYEHFSQQVMH